MNVPRASFGIVREKVVAFPVVATSALAVTVALAAICVLIVRGSASTLVALAHVDEVEARAFEIESLIVDIETGTRGFALTGDGTFLEPRVVALTVIDPKLSELETLLSREPAQVERLGRVRTGTAQLRSFSARVIATREAGGDVAGLVATGEGKRAMDGVRRTFHELQRAGIVERERLSGRSQSATWVPITLVAALLVVGALSQVFLADTFAATRSEARVALERARQAEELESQKRWLETVLEQSPAGIAIAEAASGSIVYRNPVHAASRGEVPVPTSGAEPPRLHAGRLDRSPYEAEDDPIARALRGEQVSEELAWRRHDGSRTPCLVSASPVRDAAGKIVGAVAIDQDMTARILLEQTLRESESREREARARAERDAALLDAFLTASPLGACVLDTDLRYVRANDSFAALVGRSASELADRRVTDVVPEELAERVVSILRRVLETGEPVSGVEVRGRPKETDSSEQHFLTACFPIKDATGRSIALGAIVQNITERKCGEQALRESERREREARQQLERSAALVDAFLEASPAAVAILSRDLVYERINGAYMSLLKRVPQDVIGRSVRDIVGPEMRDRAEGLLRSVVESGQPAVGVELRGRPSPADPEPRDWLVNVSPLRRRDGSVFGIGSISLDITASKRVEDALRESERREREARQEAERAVALLDSFLEASPIGVTILDQDLRYVRMNRALAAVHGLPPEAVVGRTVREVHLPDLAEPVERALRAVIATGRALTGIEVRGRTSGSGETRDWEVTIYPVRSGGQTINVGAIVEDITDRKRGERALAESEHRERSAREHAESLAAQLDAFLAASPVGFAMLDRDLRYTRVNEALAAINGLAAAAHIGRRPADILEPRIASVAEPLLRSVLETEKPVEGLELVGKTATSDRERCWISTYYPVRTRAGALLGVGGVVQEITERKDAEKERERLLAREQEARQEAERATRLRDEFLAIVTHDLRSPLAAIMLSAGRLAAGRGEEDDARRMGTRIRDSARRMDRMIQDLLDVARLDTQTLRVEPEPASAAELLREAHDSHAALAASASVHLEVEAPDPTLEGVFDRGRTLQVLSNLMGNAIRFTPKGGSVTVRCEGQERELLLSVSDSGPGIPAEQLHRVFERFWQARRGAAGGLGLGLYIAKGLVEAQGGRIWIDSEEGRGATFFFTLPRRLGSRTAASRA